MAGDPRRERELVQRAIAGDADAFGALYLMHLDAIYRYALLRVRNSTEAEDLTEQVFLKAWQAIPGYRQYGKDFIHWLYTIAHNVVVDYHRRRDSVHISLSDAVIEEEHETSVLDALVQAEDVSALSAAIAQLPEEQQQVIILRFVEGLNYNEVARIMGKSEGACRIIQYRALLALNKLLVGEQV
jgi:RNA polymerase sigma-70 factor (ECF subfamily)